MALELYLKHHNKNTGYSEKLLNKNSEYVKLLMPIFKPLSQELDDWMHDPYQGNLVHSENLIHRTPAGHFVRSKSEALIDTFLYKNNIPYRYEAPLQIGKNTIYPDFTIRHPITGKWYYWEHLGMMDNPSYAQSSANKLHLYITNGFIPNINLIITCETTQHPLCVDDIENILHQYFL